MQSRPLAGMRPLRRLARLFPGLLSGALAATLCHATAARAADPARDPSGDAAPAAATPAPGQTQVLARWVQYAPADRVLLRAIVPGGAGAICPAASVDGTAVTLAPRFPSDADFPVLECEASVPTGGRQAMIGGATLKMPVAQPKRVVVIGDTGCRIKGFVAQACNDPVAFPLRRIATYVATLNADAIVHVGDYSYRESPCPSVLGVDCTGSPYGDNWASWDADWFTPAAAILGSAPLVLSRGNHESCARARGGWFRLLDPFAYDAAAAACVHGSSHEFEPPYAVKVGAATLLMFDSSFANDATRSNSGKIVAEYHKQLSAILPTLSDPVIMVTHKPAYGLYGTGAGGVLSGGNADEQALFAGGVPKPIGLLLAGHIHSFQAVALTSADYAPQLVVGNGGTALDRVFVAGDEAGVPYRVSPSDTATTAGTADLSEFGFAVMDATAAGYDATIYDVDSNVLSRCAIDLGKRQMTCSK